MFKKKFKLRIRLWLGDFYCIEYAYYWLIPIYIKMKEFSSIESDGIERIYFPVITYGRTHLDYAKGFASKFTTYDDIKRYNKEQENKSEEWLKDYNEKHYIGPNKIQII